MADDEKKAAAVVLRIGAAIARVLDHAESHGEVYEGATDDHAILRAAIDDGHLPPAPDAS